MPFHNYRPDLMGSVEIDPAGRFETGTWESFKLTYTCGKFGIDDRGSIKIAFRTHTDQTSIQLESPSAPGYTTVETSTGIPLTVEYELRRNIRPWGKSLYIRCNRYMSEGEKIFIRFGDKREGSPGIRLQTFVEPTFEFRVLVDPFASSDYIPLPQNKQATITVGPGPGAIWKAVLPTLRGVGEEFRFCLKCEDKWGNPSDQIEQSFQLSSNIPINGLPSNGELKKGNFSFILEGLSVDAPGTIILKVFSKEGTLLAKSNPLHVEAEPSYKHYWSDLHGQSEETIGTNSAREYFEFGRDKAFLDICAHQGNDFQITDQFWQELNQLTSAFNDPGRFLTLPGFEWSGNTSLGGDHNVWYKEEGRPIYRSCRSLVYDTSYPETDCHTAQDLFDALQNEDAIVTAHIGGRFADVKYAHDAKIEPSVEIHSAWGSFEWIVSDAFDANYRVGIVASSDGHKGRPGASYPGDASFGSYGGLTCHLLESLDREALFEGFRRRHHFATTGARLFLETAVQLESTGILYHRNPNLGDVSNEPCERAIMGDIVETSDEDVAFEVKVDGSAPIERIEIRDGHDLIETLRPFEVKDLGNRIRIICEGAEYRGRGRNVSWICSVEFKGAKIEKYEPINFWNIDKLPIQESENKISWNCVTTGGYSALDVWLDQVIDGSFYLKTNEVSRDFSLSEIGLEDTRIDCGGLFKGIRIFRLPEENSENEVRVKRRIPLRKVGDTRLYVCVTQEDGHQAWSSPIYLFH